MDRLDQETGWIDSIRLDVVVAGASVVVFRDVGNVGTRTAFVSRGTAAGFASRVRRRTARLNRGGPHGMVNASVGVRDSQIPRNISNRLPSRHVPLDVAVDRVRVGQSSTCRSRDDVPVDRLCHEGRWIDPVCLGVVVAATGRVVFRDVGYRGTRTAARLDGGVPSCVMHATVRVRDDQVPVNDSRFLIPRNAPFHVAKHGVGIGERCSRRSGDDVPVDRSLE